MGIPSMHHQQSRNSILTMFSGWAVTSDLVLWFNKS